MLDTKSKSSKRISILIACILVLATTASFISMYPMLKRRAENYYTDYLHGNNFMREIYQSNCVLYKDLTERVKGRSLEYETLFLEITDSTVNNDNYDGTYDGTTLDAWKRYAGESMNQLLESWRSYMLNGIAQEIDYCVVDMKTKTSIQNTGSRLQYLGTDKADFELNNKYPFYIKMSFDSNGNVYDISVRSNQADNLMKSVQSMMNSNWLKENFKQEYARTSKTYIDDIFYYIDANGYTKKVKTNIHNTPKDAVFVYALNQKQLKYITSVWRKGIAGSNAHREEEEAYYATGTGNIYCGCLVLLAVLAFMLTRWRKYRLQEVVGTKICPEISLGILYVIGSFSVQSAVKLVNFTNRGYLDQAYLKYMTWLSENSYATMTCLINIIFLAFNFGIWYCTVTSLSAFINRNFLEMIKQRSLLYFVITRGKLFIQKRVNILKNEVLHVDLSGKAERAIRKLLLINFVVLSGACALWLFGWIALVIYSIFIYICLKKYIKSIQKQYHQLLIATSSIADGNLETEFSGDWGVFESYKQELNEIQCGFRKAVDEEVKSQKLKTELISNVSHDLKTPLTAITTYTELLKNENITQDQREEYLQVLERKSMRLKFLIDDLFEVSKANSGNVPLTLMDVDICNLIRQVYLEHEDKILEEGLTFRFQMPEEKLVLSLDSQKTYRIFENLYTNILKYAMPNTRVYVTVEKTEDEGVRIEMKNTSATELNIKPDDLTERFVRGDKSRNTEGSGLGLTIAKSFTELQKGKMVLDIDGDLFKVIIYWGKNVVSEK